MRITSPIACILILVCTFSLATAGLAQTSPEPAAPAAVGEPASGVSGPESAFASFMTAMRESDLTACAKLMHPLALAEFHRSFVALARADESGQVVALFGVETAEELSSLPPLAAFESFLHATVTMNPGMQAILGSAKSKILGSVPEDDVIHIVYRMSMEIEGKGFSKLAIAPFKRDGDSWRALLTADMEEMIQALQAQIGD